MLKKFIDTMNIKVKFDITRTGIDSDGKKFICVEILALYEGELTYVQHWCYKDKGGRRGFDNFDGNEIMGVRKGVFAYLGNDKVVEFALENEAKKFAKQMYDQL